MERKLYLLSPLQAEFYENESDRMYPDDVMDGRALAVYGADILQKMQERADHVGEDLMEYYDEKDSVKEKVTNLELSVVLKAGELMGCAEVTIQAPLDRWEMNPAPALFSSIPFFFTIKISFALIHSFVCSFRNIIHAVPFLF